LQGFATHSLAVSEFPSARQSLACGFNSGNLRFPEPFPCHANGFVYSLSECFYEAFAFLLANLIEKHYNIPERIIRVASDDAL